VQLKLVDGVRHAGLLKMRSPCCGVKVNLCEPLEWFRHHPDGERSKAVGVFCRNCELQIAVIEQARPGLGYTQEGHVREPQFGPGGTEGGCFGVLKGEK